MNGPVGLDFDGGVVHGHGRLAVAAAEGYVEFGALGNHQRTDVEVVRGDRGDDEDLRVGKADRAADAEGIGRGAGARGDDQAVGPVGREHLAVDGDIDAEHGAADAVKRDFVDGIGQEADLLAGAGALDGRVQHGPVFNPELTLHQGVQDFAGAVLAEESDAAEVYAEDRQAHVGDHMGGGKEGAVATDAQHEIRVRTDVGLGFDIIELIRSIQELLDHVFVFGFLLKRLPPDEYAYFHFLTEYVQFRLQN